jgi:hypothetical protein
MSRNTPACRQPHHRRRGQIRRELPPLSCSRWGPIKGEQWGHFRVLQPPVTAALMRIRPSGSGGLIYIHPGVMVAPLLAAFLDPGCLRDLRPRCGQEGSTSTWLRGRSTRRSRSCASWRPLIASPCRDKYTTWTAVAPDLVFTVLTYGPCSFYGPPLVRNFSSPAQQTSRSPRRAIGYARILSQVRT